MKIQAVRNKQCWGSFGVSKEAVLRLRQLGYRPAFDVVVHGERFPGGSVNNYTSGSSYLGDMDRMDPLLIQVVTELGEKANGAGADLVVETYELELDFNPREGSYEGYESRTPEAYLKRSE